MEQTPSQAIVASKTATIKDGRGRKIVVRKLKPIDELQLLEIVGGANAANERYLGLASLAYSVSSIDDVAVGRLGTKLQLETLVKELDDDGFEAIAEAVSKNFKPVHKTDAEAKEAAKNE